MERNSELIEVPSKSANCADSSAGSTRVSSAGSTRVSSDEEKKSPSKNSRALPLPQTGSVPASSSAGSAGSASSSAGSGPRPLGTIVGPAQGGMAVFLNNNEVNPDAINSRECLRFAGFRQNMPYLQITELRNIRGPDGKLWTFSEVKRAIEQHRNMVQDFRTCNTRRDYFQILIQFVEQGKNPDHIQRLPTRSARRTQYKRELMRNQCFVYNSKWADNKRTDACFEILRYKTENEVLDESDLDKQLRQDKIWYANKCRAWAIQQIFESLYDLFPGAAEEAYRNFDLIFERDQNGNIVPFSRETYFGADERDEQYLYCLLKIVPADALHTFCLVGLGQIEGVPSKKNSN